MSRILIIDDEQQVRAELRDRIEMMGHEVEEATCVEDALKLVEDFAYDCVLLDLAIPRIFEGPSNTNNGQTLLHRIVALTGAPPVLVITAHGLKGWQLASAVYKNGAKGFIAKPFEDQSVENEIREQLSKGRRHEPSGTRTTEPFSGGDLVIRADQIELCGKELGGTRGTSLIRQILSELAKTNHAGHYVRASGKQLAQMIGGDVTAPSITNAIKEFRDKCAEKLGCDKHDVIITHRGGGYQINNKIAFRHQSEERVDSQADDDQLGILRQLRATGELTSREIADRTQIPLLRVVPALSKLDNEKKVLLKGSGANAVYSIRKEPA